MQRLKRHVVSLLKKHHYWREIGFDELSELYIGMMFRSLSLSMIGVFIPLYMLNLGYSVISVAIVFGWHYTIRLFADVLAAKTILVIGPKHTIVLSHVFQIAMLLLFLTLPEFHWPLIVLGGVWGVAYSLYFVAFHVDFSKIKHTEHGGREIGLAQNMERIGYAIGPVAGGILATFFGAQFAFFIATIILFAGVIPLLSSKEQVRLHRPLDFSKFTLKNMWLDTAVFSAICIDDLVNSFYWPLFMSIFVLGGFAYAKLGFISTAGFIASVIMAKLIGQWTDKHKGRELLQISALGNAATYFVRPFLLLAGVAGVINALYQVLSVGVDLPFYKGLYDHADAFGENRVEYIMILEVVNAIIRSLICWTVVLLLMYWGSFVTLCLTFALAAIACSCLFFERFRALD